MEGSWYVSPLICMSSIVISLSLDQISWQPVPPIRVKISKTRGHTRSANACIDSKADNSSPRRLPVNDLLHKLWIHKEAGEIWVSVIGFLDTVQKYSTDDATSLPNPSKLPQFQVPTLFNALCTYQVLSLGIATYFGCIKCLPNIC